MRHTPLILLFTLALAGVLSLAMAPEPGEPRPATTYVVVRHAEKQTGDDPALTPEGQRRAQRLAGMLRSMAFDGVLSTDFRRTRETAAPAAALSGVEVELYDPREPGEALSGAGDRFRGGAVLIVGHSNTVPDLVRRLGGEAPEGDLGDEEYDNVFVVTVLGDGRVITHRLHSEPSSL